MKAVGTQRRKRQTAEGENESGRYATKKTSDCETGKMVADCGYKEDEQVEDRVVKEEDLVCY